MNSQKKIKRQVVEPLLFTSKLSYEYYVFVGGLCLIILTFLVFAIIGRLDFGSSIFCIVLFSLILYRFFGRFHSRIKLYNHTLYIHYVFPWDKGKEYKFRKINEVEKRPDVIFSPIGLLTPIKGDSSYSRGYKKLYLMIDDEETIELKYNISEDSDYEFLEILKRLIKQTK